MGCAVAQPKAGRENADLFCRVLYHGVCVGPIVGTIRIMAMRRKAEFEKGTDAFDMNGGFNAVRDEGALKEILKSIFGKQ